MVLVVTLRLAAVMISTIILQRRKTQKAWDKAHAMFREKMEKKENQALQHLIEKDSVYTIMLRYNQ